MVYLHKAAHDNTQKEIKDLSIFAKNTVLVDDALAKTKKLDHNNVPL